MKKQYTKKRITEAIAYWQKQLKKLDESIDSNIVVVRLIDIDDNPEGTYEFWLCKKENLKDTVQDIAKKYALCDDNQLDELLDEVSPNSYINCEEFGGDTWAIEILSK